MTKQTHTPGPWFRDRLSIQTKRTAPNHSCSFIASCHHGADSYTIIADRKGITDEEAEANAALIAKAYLIPECEAVISTFVKCHAGGGFVQPDKDVLDEARALLAKLQEPTL